MVTESGSSRFSMARRGRPTTNTSRTATRLKRSATKKIGENESQPELGDGEVGAPQDLDHDHHGECRGSMR